MIGPSKALSASRIATEVGECGGIDDDAGSALAAAVDPVDDLVFAVALMELDRELELGAHAPAFGLHVRQGLAAVDLRLALAEQVEIGPVQDDDDSAHALDPLCHGRAGRARPLAGIESSAAAHPLRAKPNQVDWYRPRREHRQRSNVACRREADIVGQ
jgi:hypothetical protein